MPAILSENLSNSFRAAGLVATVLVVAIHYNSKAYISPEDIASSNYFIQEFMTNGISRIAVPYFAFASGFFYFLTYKGISSYVNNLRKRTRTIVIPYFIAGIIVIAGETVFLNYLRGENYPLTISRFLMDGLLDPVSVQFWFLRDLIVLSIAAPILYLVVNKLHVFFITLLLLLWTLNIQITPIAFDRSLVRIETLFFFSLGCFFAIRISDWQSIFKLRKLTYVLAFVFILLNVIRILVDPTLRSGYNPSFTLTGIIIYKIAILIGVYCLISMSALIVCRATMFLSSFTFFVFCYHLLPFSRLVTYIGHHLLAEEYIYYFTFPFATIFTFLAAIALHRALPSFYNTLSGERSPVRKVPRSQTR